MTKKNLYEFQSKEEFYKFCIYLDRSKILKKRRVIADFEIVYDIKDSPNECIFVDQSYEGIVSLKSISVGHARSILERQLKKYGGKTQD